MSTDRKRLSSAIQRIAEQSPEIRRALEAEKSRGDQAASAGVGTSDAERDRVCCDGSVSDDPNPGTETRDPDSGGQDGGLDSDDPARLDMGDGRLSGVTDCATGEPICFDGSGFIPPDGWGEPSQPPVPEKYQEDAYQYWTYGGEDNRTFGQLENAISGSICTQGFFTCAVLGGFTGNSPGCYVVYCGASEDSSCDGFAVASYTICPSECDGDPLDDLYCGTDYGNPSESEIPYPDWPSDDCVNLSVKNGSIVGSKFDPENDGSYSAPRSSIRLCDGDNEIELAPAANGGWKTLDSTRDGGYLYDNHGRQIAHINGNEYSDPDI